MRLVNLIRAHRYDADPGVIREICGIREANEAAQTNAIIGNMVHVVDALHDPGSQMLRALKAALTDGKLCIVDISQMRGQRGLHLAGLILADIFAHNQEQFTNAEPRTIPVIAVVEEAQSVLGGAGQSQPEDGPFVSWVKEGRKYGLGAVLVTQQPGSMPPELLSQGDNFFVFHLLSAGDLFALKRANAHFSDDLLATLLNEPLVGHGVFWSSAPGTDRHARPYPLPVRVLSFEAEHRQLRDPGHQGAFLDGIYAARLRARFREALERAAGGAGPRDGAGLGDGDCLGDGAGLGNGAGPGGEDPVDAEMEMVYRNAAVRRLRQREEFWERLRSNDGIRWGTVQRWIAKDAPEDVVGDPFQWARHVVKQALVELLHGPEGSGWRTEARPHPGRPGASQTWILLTDTIEDPGDAPPPDDQPPF